MNISGDYGTELLLRYTEERLQRELEERRVVNERAAEERRESGSRLSRFARFFFREEIAAGGPEWVRPGVHAAPVVEPAVEENGKPTDEAAPLQAPETAAAIDVPTAAHGERMPSRTLVGIRR